MKYADDELASLDIMLFGADRGNHIFSATNCGNGFLPQYVINDRSGNKKVYDYFMYHDRRISRCVMKKL
ncbi:MAG: hypothetical protein IJ757_03585 [Clostridiales bacterium]|nr:hypothetical protein [Clostridiales bacterium]